MSEINNEIWKDVKGYPNYMVSNLGNVKSLNYNRSGKEQILKPIPNTFGYLQVGLCKNGKPKFYKVHRLVAEAFIPNPNNKPCIDHINTNRTDNRVDNLRWCTYRENNNNPISKKKKIGKLNYKSKPIIQLSLNGDFIKKWDCAWEVERDLGYSQSNISMCCNGKLKSAYKFKWCFAS